MGSGAKVAGHEVSGWLVFRKVGDGEEQGKAEATRLKAGSQSRTRNQRCRLVLGGTRGAIPGKDNLKGSRGGRIGGIGERRYSQGRGPRQLCNLDPASYSGAQEEQFRRKAPQAEGVGEVPWQVERKATISARPRAERLCNLQSILVLGGEQRG